MVAIFEKLKAIGRWLLVACAASAAFWLPTYFLLVLPARRSNYDVGWARQLAVLTIPALCSVLALRIPLRFSQVVRKPLSVVSAFLFGLWFLGPLALLVGENLHPAASSPFSGLPLAAGWPLLYELPLVAIVFILSVTLIPTLQNLLFVGLTIYAVLLLFRWKPQPEVRHK